MSPNQEDAEGDGGGKSASVQAVFVHVPEFDVISKDEQLKFVAALLKLLAATLL